MKTEKTPGISLICIGKFHHFALARELHSRGMLECIHTGYPRWKVGGEGLPAEKIATFPWLQTVFMALGRYNIRNAWFERGLAHAAHVTLASHVARHLEPCDVLMALSGSGLEAGRVQTARGGVYVCDRASSHIRYQERILIEEFARWDMKFPGIDPRNIAREEAEYALADLITVPSGFAYRSFREQGIPGEKLARVPFGVDLRLFNQVETPVAGDFQVLFVGQVSLRKGVPYLLEAYRQFKHPRKKLVIIGAVQPEIHRFLREADPTVQVLGSLPQPQLKEWMSRSHVMVLPSIEEGLAYVQAQAMACGCPVIASQNTGAEDLFTDGQEGFIVPIRDAGALRERLELLATDPARRGAMSAAGLVRVQRLGGWQDYAERLLGILNALLGSRRSATAL